MFELMNAAPQNLLRSLLGITDEQMMQRVVKDDDEAAFATLMRRWEGPIQRLCTQMTGDTHHAEDLAQETFTRAFLRRKDYQATGKVSTWLWRIALNLCYNELRRRRRRPEMSLDAPVEESTPFSETLAGPEAGPDQSLEVKEHGELVRQALLQLSEPHRAVLVLRHYQDLKFREIAAVLEIPEGTVKSRMGEALTALNRKLRHSLPVSESNPKESLIL